VVVRASVYRGENRKIDLLSQLLPREDETRSRSSKSLVCGRSHYVSVLKGVVRLRGSYEAANVRDIGHEVGAY